MAKCEGVPLEWLLTGISDSHYKNKPEAEPAGWVQKELNDVGANADLSKIIELLKLLKREELAQLASVLGLKGAETVLYLLDEDNLELLKLDKVVKEKILGRQPQATMGADMNDQKARECDSDDVVQASANSLASKRKQAG